MPDPTALLWTRLQALPDASTLLCIAAAFWFAGGALALTATRRTLRRIARKLTLLEQVANSTTMDLKTLIRGGDRFEEKRCEIESSIALVSERQDMLELRASGGVAYDHAIDLARMGLSVEQLMRSVGVTRGEAELLTHLHHGTASEAA